MRRLLAVALVLAALPPLAAAVTGAPCPVGPPLAVLQNDAGSGRDAGSDVAHAVALGQDGHFWGTMDAPLQTGVQDEDDLYVAVVPPGPRDVTVEIKSIGKLLDPESSWPFVYWLEVFRAGAAPPAFLGSWEDPITFASPGGETLLVDIYLVPLLWEDLCAPQPPWAGPQAPALPAEPQLYRALFDCDPDCFA